MRTLRSVVGIGSGVLLLAAATHAEVTVSTGFDFSRGDYGLPVPTQIITVPLAVSYAVNRTTWELGLSCVRVEGPGDVVPGIGRRTRRLALASTTHEGIGDLTLGFTHQLVAPAERGWSWAAGAEVKFGTASAERSLGTGKDDFTVQAECSYTAGALTPYFTVGYRWLGNPAGSDLRAHIFGTAGLTWACSDKVTLGALVDLSAKNSASGSSSANFMLSASRSLGDRWQAQLYAVRGTSDNSPDFGGGLSLSRGFY